MPATIVHLLRIHIEFNAIVKLYDIGIFNVFHTVLMLLLPSTENRSQLLIKEMSMIL